MSALVKNYNRRKISFKSGKGSFLFSTRFLFQNLDRVIFFDNELNLVGDTDTLDLDPRSFSTRLDTIELEILNPLVFGFTIFSRACVYVRAHIYIYMNIEVRGMPKQDISSLGAIV